MTSEPWRPTFIRRHIRSLPSGSYTMLVDTDQGEGYLKAMGSPAGPHVLACDLVGTRLAAWLGLPTFDIALISVTDDDELPFANSASKAASGPALISKAVKGMGWSGEASQLRLVENTSELARLVVLDTWIRNRDRHHPDPAIRRPNYDNVFFTEEGAQSGKRRLIAMDHSHCFSDREELTPQLSQAQYIRDDRCYGRFLEFLPFIERSDVRIAAGRLGSMIDQDASQFVAEIPPEWDVDSPTRTALVEFIVKRAQYVASTVENRIFPQGEFTFDQGQETDP